MLAGSFWADTALQLPETPWPEHLLLGILLLGILQPSSPGMQRMLRALDVAPLRPADLVAVELATRR